MNTDVIMGKWLQIRGSVKQKWGDLTDDEIAKVDGNIDRLTGLLQERYGYTREHAKQEIDTFLKQFETEGSYSGSQRN